jgi:hypothetical protein
VARGGMAVILKDTILKHLTTLDKILVSKFLLDVFRGKINVKGGGLAAL